MISENLFLFISPTGITIGRSKVMMPRMRGDVELVEAAVDFHLAKRSLNHHLVKPDNLQTLSAILVDVSRSGRAASVVQGESV